MALVLLAMLSVAAGLITTPQPMTTRWSLPMSWGVAAGARPPRALSITRLQPYLVGDSGIRTEHAAHPELTFHPNAGFGHHLAEGAPVGGHLPPGLARSICSTSNTFSKASCGYLARVDREAHGTTIVVDTQAHTTLAGELDRIAGRPTTVSHPRRRTVQADPRRSGERSRPLPGQASLLARCSRRDGCGLSRCSMRNEPPSCYIRRSLIIIALPPWIAMSASPLEVVGPRRPGLHR